MVGCVSSCNGFTDSSLEDIGRPGIVSVAPAGWESPWLGLRENQTRIYRSLEVEVPDKAYLTRVHNDTIQPEKRLPTPDARTSAAPATLTVDQQMDNPKWGDR